MRPRIITGNGEENVGFHSVGNVQYGIIAYDREGTERPEGEHLFSSELIEQLSLDAITDVFFFSHGWKGDLPAAIEQYDRWINALASSAGFEIARKRVPAFSPLFIGL